MKDFKVQKRSIISALAVTLFLTSCSPKPAGEASEEDKKIEHGVVFYEEGRYAGWPANNGIWLWGNEVLVGFVEAEHRDSDGFHTCTRGTMPTSLAQNLTAILPQQLLTPVNG